MSEFILMLVVDLFLCGTGLVIVWVFGLGRGGFKRPGKGSVNYFLLSLLGLIFWLLILFVFLSI